MKRDASVGCHEYQELSRRQFMAVTGGGIAAASLPAWLPSVAFAQDYCSTRDVIISVFLRGAADGLSLCVPHQDSFYYSSRPTLAVPRPGTGPLGALNLDGFFGLPPSMAPLLPVFNAGHLAIVHATGSTDPSRSHFDAQRFMEVGKPGDTLLASGWLGRHLETVPPRLPNATLRAIGIGDGLQRTLRGAPLAIPIPDMNNFGLDGSPGTTANRFNALQDMYALEPDPLRAAAATTRVTIDLLDNIDFDGYVPGGGAVYGTDQFAYAMKSTAALIKADIGVEAVHIDVPGWDTHVNQGTLIGTLADLMRSLATTLAAFHADMFSGNGRNFVVVVHSEFGRRVHENGSLGLDHGHGNAMFLMGTGIAGGRVISQWPGLAQEQLFEGRDLQVTIDYRDILAEIVARRLGNNNLAYVFPGFVPTFRGVTSQCMPGDMNCDGQVGPADLTAMGQALTDPAVYQANHPTCNVMTADMNGDGVLNGHDVRSFVQRFVH